MVSSFAFYICILLPVNIFIWCEEDVFYNHLIDSIITSPGLAFGKKVSVNAAGLIFKIYAPYLCSILADMSAILVLF